MKTKDNWEETKEKLIKQSPKFIQSTSVQGNILAALQDNKGVSKSGVN